MPSPLRSLVALSVASAALATGAATAAGASITPVDPSPAEGAQFQTTDDGVKITFAWTADRTGCASSSTTARLDFMGPRPFTRTVGNALPNGSIEIEFRTSTAQDVFMWNVSMTCNTSNDVTSETRSFTNLPPNPEPRFAGRYLVNARGVAARRWRASPRCRQGACNTRLKIPGQPGFLLRFNSRRSTYSGKLTRARGTCRVNFFRTVRNGLRGSIQVAVRVSDTEIEGARTFASVLRGRVTTVWRPTARGKRLGCRPSRSRTPIAFLR